LLKHEIRDGFPSPYKVVKIHIDRDVEATGPRKASSHREGEEVATARAGGGLTYRCGRP
jgi:type I restriction enzyme, R subunit